MTMNAIAMQCVPVVRNALSTDPRLIWRFNCLFWLSTQSAFAA